MADAVANYLNSMRRKFKHLATWLPTVRLEPGVIGVPGSGGLSRRTSLDKRGVRFEIQEIADRGDLTYKSSRSTRLHSFASASDPMVGPVARGQVRVSLSGAGASVFSARNCVENAIVDLEEVTEQVLPLVAKNKWKSEWILVTEVLRAESGTVVVCLGRSASLDLSVQTGTGDESELLLIGANATIAGESGEVVRVIAKNGLTPLYRAVRLRKHWFSDPDMGDVRRLYAGGRRARPKFDDLFLDATPSHLLA